MKMSLKDRIAAKKAEVEEVKVAEKAEKNEEVEEVKETKVADEQPAKKAETKVKVEKKAQVKDKETKKEDKLFVAVKDEASYDKAIVKFEKNLKKESNPFINYQWIIDAITTEGGFDDIDDMMKTVLLSYFRNGGNIKSLDEFEKAAAEVERPKETNWGELLKITMDNSYDVKDVIANIANDADQYWVALLFIKNGWNRMASISGLKGNIREALRKYYEA